MLCLGQSVAHAFLYDIIRGRPIMVIVRICKELGDRRATIPGNWPTTFLSCAFSAGVLIIKIALWNR